MRTLTNLALTAAAALYLLFILAGLVCLAYAAPLWTLVAFPAMAANGWMAADLVEGIWRLDGQYDDETV
jgi:hypothetical protein